MAYVSPDQVEKARQMDLLTYLRTYEPDELVHVGGNTYCTRTHDSLKISNGKWYWFSRSIGGYSALDYLMEVKNIPFLQAVEQLSGQAAASPPVVRQEKTRTLLLPKANPDTAKAEAYLQGRGIDSEIIRFCIQTGRLYESDPHHSVVFVGRDRYGKPRYANIRGTTSGFKGEANGSDKRFSFSIPAQGSDTVHLFESAIDLLSYATMRKRRGEEWNTEHLLSLAGVYRPKKELRESSLPLALKQYLQDHPGIRKIVLRLDRDAAGKESMNALYALLSDRYEVTAKLPRCGKDYNDALCMSLGIPTTKPSERRQER